MNSPQMLTDGISDARAWRANSIDDTAAWYYPLSEDCVSDFERIIRDAQRQPRPITEISRPAASSNGCGECLRPVLDALNSGRGFAIVERAPIEQAGVEGVLSMYWMIGQFLGHAHRAEHSRNAAVRCARYRAKCGAGGSVFGDQCRKFVS